MNDSLPEIKRLLLKRLARAKGQRLRFSEFKLYENDKKRLSVDPSQIQVARDELVSLGLITETKKGNGGSYQLTAAGTAALRLPPPPPVGHDEILLPYHKSYLLFLLLISPSRTASFADVCKRLSNNMAKGPLCFWQLLADNRRILNRPLVAWLLDTLADSGAIARTESKGSASYRLLDAGEELLGASDQYPTEKPTIRISGKHLAELMVAARLAGKSIAAPQEYPAKPESEQLPSPPHASLTAEQLFAEYEQLKEERYSQHGMVPIHELRQTIATKFGGADAGHNVFDVLLKDLRRHRKIRFVAIGNAGDATEQQLEDSIRGENEIYFMIENAHEPVSV